MVLFRAAFGLNRTVVLRYRFFLEQKNLAPSTINVRLAAVRRLAYEASDCGLLSPDLAAGIRRVKGAKRLGVRIGNWLTLDQSRTLIRESPSDSLRGKRDRAILALLVGCGLRRAELAGLATDDFPGSRGTPLDRRPDWQRETHPYGSGSSVGETRCR